MKNRNIPVEKTSTVRGHLLQLLVPKGGSMLAGYRLSGVGLPNGSVIVRHHRGVVGQRRSRVKQSSVLISFSSLDTSSTNGRRLVKLHTSDRIVVPVTTDHDEEKTLQAYMRLPVSQYVLIKVPLGGSLKRVSTDCFQVIVPPVRFFDLWVQPRVVCRVRLLSQPDRVDIRCLECIIDGSPAVRHLRLNERVQFDVRTSFTPQQGLEAPAIVSGSSIDVVVEPPGPFALFPDALLQTVGNAGLYASLSTLQRVFITSLAEDYARWANDARYREERLQYAAQSDEMIRMQESTAPAVQQVAAPAAMQEKATVLRH